MPGKNWDCEILCNSMVSVKDAIVKKQAQNGVEANRSWIKEMISYHMTNTLRFPLAKRRGMTQYNDSNETRNTAKLAV